MTSLAITSDFHQAFKVQTTRLLRERFLWFTGILALVSGVWVAGRLGMFLLLSSAVSETAAGGERIATYIGFVQPGVDLVIYGLVFVRAGRRPVPDHQLVKLSQAIIIVDGVLTLLIDAGAGLWGGASIWSLLLPHVLAAAFLPWTLRQAILPVLPVLALNAVLALGSMWMGDRSGSSATMVLLGSLMVPMPGVIVAALKHDSRVRNFRVQFLESRYGQVRRELADARRIHESLFPLAEARGTIRFDYRYQPMRLIGGDYLYARFHEAPPGEDPALTMLVMDVTGHGVAAALTVNRLYGEVERLFGENPGIGPGQVVRALNRYVYNTLANHALYVTAVCVRVDPARDRLEYCSAGHPPAFLRAVDGTIDQLDSTTYLLGAVSDPEFDDGVHARPFVRGDTLLLYTDGAMEAADAQGRQFGIPGLQRTIAASAATGPGEWSATVLTAVDRHRDGPPADDTLVVEIARLIIGAPSTAPGGQTSTVFFDPRRAEATV